MRSNLATVHRAILPTLAATAIGLSISPIVVAIAVAAEFLSAGSDVPYLSSFVLVQPAFLTLGILVVLLGTAIIWSILRRSFAAIGLGIIVLVATPVGCVPGIMVFSAAEDRALGIFSDRSMVLVRAIENYRSAFGHPPSKLADLIPQFLKELPGTGLPGYSEFYYAPEAGSCSAHNAWHLSIAVPEFGVRYLIYCPMQDYDAMDLDEQYRVKQFGAWVRTSM
jgi:hypothetical protein